MQNIGSPSLRFCFLLNNNASLHVASNARNIDLIGYQMRSGCYILHELFEGYYFVEDEVGEGIGYVANQGGYAVA